MDELSITKIKELVGIPRANKMHDELIEAISHSVYRLCFLSLRGSVVDNPRIRKPIRDAITKCVAGRVIQALAGEDFPVQSHTQGQMLEDEGVEELDSYLSGSSEILSLLINEGQALALGYSVRAQ